MRARRRLALAVGFLLAAASDTGGEGLELLIPYPVFLDMVERQFLDDEGRHYLRGTAETPCNYAFVEAPAVVADGGRLQVSLRFRARAAARVAKRCIGPADSFALTMSGRPAYRDGEIVVEEIEYDSPNRVYDAVLETFLAHRLPRSLSFPILQVFDRLQTPRLAAPQSTALYELRLGELSVSSVEVTEEALAIRADMRLTVSLQEAVETEDAD